ncbi:uncharacterized protein SEPMUDRAFT_151120 [Sphaerulina musiva SO2202]|uniref:Uncharacterized protein n=1 Tax=Sphaerulina musiva (strain SO2202) TaxID=692275 RepID=M3CCE8_SPHMS|nr:uncharacterized protein SEPMUDRAFT_151120 [Sphaerulina musiva SO2202]EMF10062.1 hypothetical protein SEPMUDRAFT_151120 [Sphaerulina musiva SO2202]
MRPHRRAGASVLPRGPVVQIKLRDIVQRTSNVSAMFAFRTRNEHAGPGGVVGTLAGFIVSRLDLAVMVKRAASCREELHLHSGPS